MNALVMRLRSEARHRWRAWLGLVLMIGVFGGTTIATVAGARRTDSAYPRFLASSNPYDQFLLGVSLYDESADPVTPQSLSTIRQVATVIRSEFFYTTDDHMMIGSADDRLGRTFNAVKVIEGHRPQRADEIGVPVAITEERGYHVGQTITVPFARLGQNGEPVPVPIRMKVAAIIAAPGEFPPYGDLGPPSIHLTSAFVRANQDRVFHDRFFLVWLRHGTADLKGFRDGLRSTFGGRPAIGYAQSALTKNVVRSFHLQATSLWLFAACLAIVAMLVLGQTLGRQSLIEGTEYPALRALGLTRRELTLLGLIRASLLAVAGVVIAIPVAILLSPLAPRGLARAAEPHPGFAVDATAIGLGAGIAVAALLAFAAIPSSAPLALLPRSALLRKRSSEFRGERSSPPARVHRRRR